MRVFAILSILLLTTSFILSGSSERQLSELVQRGRFGRALELRISPQLITGTNQDSGVEVRYRRSTLLLPDGQEKMLAAPIMATGEKSEGIMLKIRGEDGREEQINLPRSLKVRLQEYLSWGPDRRPFDCGSFVHFLYHLPYRPGNFNSLKWEIRSLVDERQLKAGDAILLSDSSEDPNRPVHFAIYLAHGLYLSKFGNIGGLIVTDLEQMRVGFGGTKAFRILPKQALQAS